MSYKFKSLNKKKLLQEIARWTGKPYGVIPRSYLFESKFARHRMERGQIMFWSNGQMDFKFISNLQFLFNSLDPKQRADLFPGNFDLGNGIPAQVPTKEELTSEMQKVGCETATEDGFRTAKEQIGKFAGHHFDRYFEIDPSKSLKVLKTLMSLKEHSFRHMYKFLTVPGEGDPGSLEMVDSNPLQNDAAVERAALLADLKAHLALEIPSKRRQEIDTIYEAMRDNTGRTVTEIQRVAAQYANMDVRQFEANLAAVQQLLTDLPKAEVTSQPFLPLDEQLYIHCNGLEFLHYAIAQRPIYRDQSPKLNVKTLVLKVEGLPDMGQGPQLHIEAFADFAKNNEEMLLTALNRTLGYEVDPKYFDEAIPLARKVLRLSKAFESEHGALMLEHGFWTDPTSCLAALASVFHEKHHPTKGFKPAWHGRKNISGNVIAALKNYRLSPDPKDNVVPEAFTRFWNHQFQWFSHSLRGALRIYYLKLAVQQQLIDGLEPLVRQHDTALLASRLAEYSRLAEKVAEMLSQTDGRPAVRPNYRPKSYY